ncbi:MAG: hypothetical protein ACHQC8_02605 [Solirubrobacterales bacterium]
MRQELYWSAIVIIDCGVCHIPFGLPASMQRSRAEDGKTFYCPNGHVIWYVEDENSRLKRQLAEAEEKANWRLARLNEERDAHSHTTHQLHGTQGALVKVKRRVSRGICPCCTRTFSNLQKHLEDMHPQYVKDTA